MKIENAVIPERESMMNNQNARMRSLIQSMRKINNNWQLYAMIFPVILYFVVFEYWPIYGVQIAFKDFVPSNGITGSEWIGFDHFERFFNSYQFKRIILNTVTISLASIVFGFPLPIILAISMNEVRNKRIKKFVQNVTYAPHFLSLTVLVGLMMIFLSPRNGIINKMIVHAGGEAVYFMGDPGWFKFLFVSSGIWQHLGWGTIIYMAALTSINPGIIEASIVDGANKLQRIKHVIIPGILPTAIILLILSTGQIMSVGFEKIFLMQNSMNMEASDVIATYVYRNGLLGLDYSFASAVGLFNSVVSFAILLAVNSLARRMTESSLW